MAEQDNETTDKVLMKRLAAIGIKIEVDQDYINRQLSPAMAAISKKLNQLSKESKMDKDGIFGAKFFQDKIKNITGFDYALIKSTKTMLGYGLASKNMNLDNQEFYKSLGFISKRLVDVASGITSWRKAGKDASDQSKENTSSLASALASADKNSATLAAGLDSVATSAEVGAVEMGAFATIATGGLALLAVAIVGIGAAFYKMFTSAMSARDEVKKFDQLVVGMGQQGVTEFAGKLQHLNKAVWGLGFSLEQVNGVALDFAKAGVSLGRSLDTNLVSSVLTLSGATGVASSEISGLYGELLKSTKISVDSLTAMGDTFTRFNQIVFNGTNLGQVSFATFREAISSSANALAIATARGEEFTNKMTRDLMSLSGLATTLSLSVSELNGLFESAGSLISDQNSPFRAFLAISGGANINQMLTNQFDKTDAMLRGITFLQNLNKSFGENIQITAQVGAQLSGLSKETVIKMINTRQETIADMLKAQQQLATIQTDATKDAYEKVNSDLTSVWNRIKTMFVTMFQNIIGGSSGMNNLLRSVENFLMDFKRTMEHSGLIDTLGKIVDKVANWLGNNLVPMIEFVNKMLSDFANPDKSIWKSLIDLIVDGLKLPFFLLGQLAGEGFRAAMANVSILGMKPFAGAKTREQIEKELSEKRGVLGSFGNNRNMPELDYLNNRLSAIDKQEGQLSKYSPDTVTYGKTAGGKVGFMTVGQKEYALEEEKKRVQAEIAKNTKSAAEDIHEVRLAVCHTSADTEKIIGTPAKPVSPLAKLTVNSAGMPSMPVLHSMANGG